MYPFLPEAKDFAKQDVLNSDIDDALSYLREPLSEEVFLNPGQHVKWYALAKAILSACTHTTKTDFALKKAQEYVARINRNGEAERVGKMFFPSLTVEGDAFRLTLKEYLTFGQQLVHQGVHDGRVRIEGPELNAMLIRAIAEKFLDAHAQELPEAIRKAAFRLEPEMQVKASGRKFLSLGCQKHIQQGVGEGKRFYGSMSLVVAAQKDGLTKEATRALLEKYVANCSGTAPFILSEAERMKDRKSTRLNSSHS